uniref:Tick serine protease n=1 Tax=Rhipicephalus zambeziensis TaxID=60191 RepID=A0A224YP08_9ACAR
MLIHKDYDMYTSKHDIALLEVKYPFTFGEDVSPICLQVAPGPIVDKDAVAAGWGSAYYKGLAFDILRHTSVTIYPDQICSMMHWRYGYTPGIQCCSFKRGTGVCSGDSGGPLMIRTGVDRFQQVGISSYVSPLGCGGKEPDVYTRVNAYGLWLTQGVSSSAGYMPLQTAYML